MCSYRASLPPSSCSPIMRCHKDIYLPSLDVIKVLIHWRLLRQAGFL